MTGQAFVGCGAWANNHRGVRMHLFRQLLSDLRGATAIEYGLIAAIMSVALISGYGAFTGALMGTFNTIETRIVDAGK
jgi:pilus assembly protein Flp/PilA